MVHLRPAELFDVDAIYQFRQDEEVMFWAAGGFGDALSSRCELEDQIEQDSALNSTRMFVIEVEEEAEHRVVGTITFRNFNRVNRRCEVGMLIGDKDYWGRGIGTEAMQQFIRLLFTRYNVNRIDLDTFSDNQRALRCYKKCGFVEEGLRRQSFWTMNGYRDQIMMGLLREDWLKEHGNDVYYL